MLTRVTYRRVQNVCLHTGWSSQGPGTHRRILCKFLSGICTGKAWRPVVEAGKSAATGWRINARRLTDVLWKPGDVIQDGDRHWRSQENSQSSFEEKPPKSSFSRKIDQEILPSCSFTLFQQQPSDGSSAPQTTLTHFSWVFLLKVTIS